MKKITKTETLPDGRTRTSTEYVPLDDYSSMPQTTSASPANMKKITKIETLPDGRTRTTTEYVPMDDNSYSTSTSVPTSTKTTVQPTTPTTTKRPSMMDRMKNAMPTVNKSSSPIKMTPTSKLVADNTTQPVMSMKSQPVMTMQSQPIMHSKPVGRSMKTRQIQHPDGSIETITEVTETLPDGTTRTSSSSKITNGTGMRSSPAPGRRIVVASGYP
jgi:hypothetical protein